MLTFIMRIEGISSFLEYLFNVYGICLELLVMVTTVKHTHIHHCPWDPRFHKVKGYFIPFVHSFFFFCFVFRSLCASFRGSHQACARHLSFLWLRLQQGGV